MVASAGPTISGGTSKYIEFIDGQKSRLFSRLETGDWRGVEDHLGEKLEVVLPGARIRIVGRVTEHHGLGRNLVILGTDAIEVLEPRVRSTGAVTRYAEVQAAYEDGVNAALNQRITLVGPVLTRRYLGDIDAWFVQIGSVKSSVRLVVPNKVHRAVFGAGADERDRDATLRVDGHLQLYGGFPAMAIEAADQIVMAR